VASSFSTDLVAVGETHRRLVEWLRSVTPPEPTDASELEGWTVGHVMTHIARNADGFTRMIAAAERGDVGDQYGGGRAGREAEISAGATRGWSELVVDVVASSDRLGRSFAAVPDEVWATGQGRLQAGVEPVREFPHRRAREVEIHRLDLGLGATYLEWSEGFVAREWPLSVGRLATRLPDGAAVRLLVEGSDAEVVGAENADPVELRGTRTDLLAWIVGRRDVAGAPALASWP
jgi:maleylpyruvate isomerase